MAARRSEACARLSRCQHRPPANVLQLTKVDAIRLSLAKDEAGKITELHFLKPATLSSIRQLDVTQKSPLP